MEEFDPAAADIILEAINQQGDLGPITTAYDIYLLDSEGLDTSMMPPIDEESIDLLIELLADSFAELTIDPNITPFESLEPELQSDGTIVRLFALHEAILAEEDRPTEEDRQAQKAEEESKQTKLIEAMSDYLNDEGPWPNPEESQAATVHEVLDTICRALDIDSTRLGELIEGHETHTPLSPDLLQRFIGVYDWVNRAYQSDLGLAPLENPERTYDNSHWTTIDRRDYQETGLLPEITPQEIADHYIADDVGLIGSDELWHDDNW